MDIHETTSWFYTTFYPPVHGCKLNQPLYGLKQAPHALINKFNNSVISYCFMYSIANPSLFYI